MTLDHSLDLATYRMLIVAEWWRVDPGAVDHWSIVEFWDREEYMQLQIAKQRLQADD